MEVDRTDLEFNYKKVGNWNSPWEWIKLGLFLLLLVAVGFPLIYFSQEMSFLWCTGFMISFLTGALFTSIMFIFAGMFFSNLLIDVIIWFL